MSVIPVNLEKVGSRSIFGALFREKAEYSKTYPKISINIYDTAQQTFVIFVGKTKVVGQG